MPFTRDQINDINKIIRDSLNKNLYDNEAFVTKLVDAVVEKVSDKFQERIETLEKQVVDLKATTLHLETKLHKVEQQGKNSTLRIFGVEEEDGENTHTRVVDLCNNKLKIPVRLEQVEDCFRTFSKNNGKRTIIAKFSNEHIKQRLLSARKNLKQTNIFIAEDLTKYNLDLLNKAIEKYGKNKAWSWNGRIYVDPGNNKKKVITKIEDLQNS